MDYLQKLIDDIECHSVEGIEECFANGVSPIDHYKDLPLNYELTNNSREMMEDLLSLSADLKMTIPGFIWGKSYPWETLIPSVNPISYPMMGLLPQMHRKEKRISEIVSLLLKAGYGIDYVSRNIPNAYLK